MITWMQRHKKYLIVTIWISTIAFVGAGFVGWGQYSYGDKAGAVAKVGDVEITMGELQKAYSRIYSQYNQMFQGNFDEEKAKAFGLQRQALQQLTNQALILNLAQEYDLRISDQELLQEITSQEYFFKDGRFDKTIYKETLSRSNLSSKEYEQEMKKQLLIQKVFSLLPVEVNQNESEILNTVMSIADKIEYKVLDDSNISVDVSDEVLKPFWENQKNNFMTEVSYNLSYIKQEKVSNEYSQADIEEYYAKNKNSLKDPDGKIIPLDMAKNLVEERLNAKATKDLALRTYIAFKKRKLEDESQIQKITISQTNNPFSQEVLQKVSSLSITSPFLKPIEVDGEFFTFELLKVNASQTKTFDQAKDQVTAIFVAEKKKEKLFNLASESLPNFTGVKTDFISNTDAEKISLLNKDEANEFLMKLFNAQNKNGTISLASGKLVIYNILEQKLLNKTHEDTDSMKRLKSTIFSAGLMKNLSKKYKTEIFVQGL